MMKQNIQALFNPQSIAIIGASNTPGKIGYFIVKNMLESGFTGRIFPVNPGSDEILGLKVIKKISQLPVKPDLAVICVPRQFVLSVLKELGQIGTRAVIVISAGFKETGKDGFLIEQELADVARQYNIALLGPNCLGLINPHAKVNASFAQGHPRPGNIAFFSQSGALCVAILDWALGGNIGFSKFISLGNKAILDEADMIAYLGKDEKTKVILGYIENVCCGERFIAEALKVTHQKPIIMIKSGTTSAGIKAASSHTGAMAGSDQAYTAAFKKAGIIRVGDVETLFNLARAFSTQPLPQGPNLAILTNSGGPGIMAADVCERSALNMASMSSAIVHKLQKVLPPYASLYNPIDIIGDATAGRYLKSLEIILEDSNVHAILILLTPTSAIAHEIDGLSAGIARISKKALLAQKPVFVCYMGKKQVEKGRKVLLDAGIPCYNFPEPAIKSIEAMYLYYQWQKTPEAEPVYSRVDREKAKKVIFRAKKENQNQIVEFQAHEIVRAYNLPVPETRLARSSEEAVFMAMQIGFPVVLKIASPHISHKTDVGGVMTGLKTPEEVKTAFSQITHSAQRLRREAYIAGCLVQKMAPKGCKEVIVGFKRDEQFGPLVMFGLGGIYVEVLKDISFRLAPLTAEDARTMIREIKSYLVLKGFRGEPGVNFAALEKIILAISQLACDFPEIYEAEFNPVLVNHEKALVADVRLSLSY